MTNYYKKPMQVIAIGNWKMNVFVADAVKMARKLHEYCSEHDNNNIEVIISPSFISLYAVGLELKGSSVNLCAQDVFWEDSGAFTGEISPLMLKDVGCRYVLIGHSERRHIIGETDEEINKKVKTSIKHGLVSVLCVGELLKEREEGKTFEKIKGQITNNLKDISSKDMQKIIIAYEPVWAIGTGIKADPMQIKEVYSYIRELITGLYDSVTADNLRILYGGSVTPENVNKGDSDGVLVGSASLNLEKFISIIEKIKNDN